MEERQVQLPKEEHTEFGMQCGLQEVRPARWTAGRSPWVLETTRGDWTWLGSSGGGHGRVFSMVGFAFRNLALLLVGEWFVGRWGPALLVARRGEQRKTYKGWQSRMDRAERLSGCGGAGEPCL